MVGECALRWILLTADAGKALTLISLCRCDAQCDGVGCNLALRPVPDHHSFQDGLEGKYTAIPPQQ